MRLINTKAHGIVDYLMGALLIASPWMFHFTENSSAKVIPMALGITILLMAVLTKYELGLYRLILMKVHLGFDLVFGLFLAVSPWLLNFNHEVYKPHLVFGIAIAAISLLTDRVSFPAHKNTPVPQSHYKKTPAPGGHYRKTTV